MQPLTVGPRAGMDPATVVALIRDTHALRVSSSLEVLNPADLSVAETLPAVDFAGGSVSRNAFATLHGTADLGMWRLLDWQRALVRPVMTLSDGVTSADFRLGAYFTSNPSRSGKETPQLYVVKGVDVLWSLNQPVSETFTMAAGAAYLTVVEEIMLACGVPAFLIDQESAAAVSTTNRTWKVEDNTRWLTIVNELLAAVGYAGAWSDWDGVIRAEPYDVPRLRTAEWVYDTGAYTSMTGDERDIEEDYFDAPNQWVFYRTNMPEGVAPQEGAGIYRYTNGFDGPTSVEARGRVVGKAPEGVDAADQAALERAALVTIEADMRVSRTLRVMLDPQPLSWHMDRVRYDDPVMGEPMEAVDTQWTQPLNGDRGAHEWSLL